MGIPGTKTNKCHYTWTPAPREEQPYHWQFSRLCPSTATLYQKSETATDVECRKIGMRSEGPWTILNMHKNQEDYINMVVILYFRGGYLSSRQTNDKNSPVALRYYDDKPRVNEHIAASEAMRPAHKLTSLQCLMLMKYASH